VVLFQSHFLSSVLAKFLAKTCYKFMTFWQNRAKFTTALSWVLAILLPRGSKSVHLCCFFKGLAAVQKVIFAFSAS
jgi:hypothetical protein